MATSRRELFFGFIGSLLGLTFVNTRKAKAVSLPKLPDIKVRLGIGTANPAYPMDVVNSGQEVFCVTSAGDVVRDGRVITDDDAAIADCFFNLLKIGYNVSTNRK